MKKLTSSAILLLLMIIPTVVLSDDKTHIKHNSQMDHSQHSVTKALSNHTTPVEAGHDGFGTIAEIVTILSNNPNTDWTRVNITGLRNHLLDMDRLISSAKVEEQKVTGGIRFNITGEAEVINSIQNMVVAHAIELNKLAEYTTMTEVIDNGIALTITSKADNTVAKIKGLGFFGLMTTGSHHQKHHLAMALGNGHGLSRKH